MSRVEYTSMDVKGRGLYLLIALFITALTTSNLTASKIIVLGELWGITLLSPAAVVAYAITFLITDIISEVWGRETASKVVFAGFISQLLVIALVWTAIILPIAPFQGQEYQEAYTMILGPSTNIVVASLIAYLISQYHDVWAFHKWRQVTRGRHLWLRNNASTMISQLIDTTVFITLAFTAIPWVVAGAPIIQLTQLPSLVLGQYMVKLTIAALDTPFCYLGVKLARTAQTMESMTPQA